MYANIFSQVYFLTSKSASNVFVYSLIYWFSFDTQCVVHLQYRTIPRTPTFLQVQLVLSNERAQLRELTNEDGAFRRFSAFPEVLDRSDFRLREFKMAATGKSVSYIQTIIKH